VSDESGITEFRYGKLGEPFGQRRRSPSYQFVQARRTDQDEQSFSYDVIGNMSTPS